MIEQIREKAKIALKRNDGAHDYNHSYRVEQLASAIQMHEGGEIEVIIPACYVHDWGCYMGREEHVSTAALDEIRTELEDIGLSGERLENVLEAVRFHEEYDFSGKHLPVSKECMILQDADRLDALGAIGIARSFYVTGTLFGAGNERCVLGTPEDMHKGDQEYNVGDLTPAVQHFYDKLLCLRDVMNTEHGRKIAEGRHQYMVEFLERFKREWKGEL